MSSNNKIIMIDGKNSGWYDKAIFILNEKGTKNYPGNKKNMVHEAEKIVQAYINKSLYNTLDKKDYVVTKSEIVTKNKYNKLLILGIVLSGSLLLFSIISLLHML